MDIKLEKEFIENGFYILEPNKFNFFINDKPEKDLAKIINLKNQINKELPNKEFFTTLTSKIDDIKKLVDGDEYINLSDKKLVADFNNTLNLFYQQISAISEFIKIESSKNLHHTNILIIQKALVDLNTDNKLTPQQKNKKVLELNEKLVFEKKNYNQLNDLYHKQLHVLHDLKIDDMKNDILTTINKLNKLKDNLALTPNNKENLNYKINDLASDIAFYGVKSDKQMNFEALCSASGIGYNKNEDKVNKKNIFQKLEPANCSLSTKDNLPKQAKENSNLKIQLPKEENQYTLDSSNNKEVLKNNFEKIKPVGPKIKVVARRTCKWLNNHKKEILIAIGITALIVATIMAFNALIPAIGTMLETSKISLLSSAMVHNASLWGEAVASEQIALHSANTALASIIETISGTQAIYTPASGIWTIGGTELTSFAASALAQAEVATSTVTALSSTVLGLGIGGLSLTGLGALLKKESKDYHELNNLITKLEKNQNQLSSEKLLYFINRLDNIKNSKQLSEKEKNTIANKLNNLKNNLTKEGIENDLSEIKGGR